VASSDAVGPEHDASFLQANEHEQGLEASADARGASNSSRSSWVVAVGDIPTIQEIVAALSTDADDLTVTWFNHPDVKGNWYYESLNYVASEPEEALTWHLLFGHGFAPALASRESSGFDEFMATMPYTDPVPTKGDEDEKRNVILLARRDYVVSVLLAFAKTKGLYDKLIGMKLQSIRHLHEHDHLGPKAARWSLIPDDDEDTRAKIPKRAFQVAASAKTLTFLKALSGGDDDFDDWRTAVDVDKEKILNDMTGVMTDELHKQLIAEGHLPDSDSDTTSTYWDHFRRHWVQAQKTQAVQGIDVYLVDVEVSSSETVPVIKGVVKYEGGYESEVYVEITPDQSDDIKKLAGDKSLEDGPFEAHAKMVELVLAWRRSFIHAHAKYFESRKPGWFGGEIGALIDRMAGPIIRMVLW